MTQATDSPFSRKKDGDTLPETLWSKRLEGLVRTVERAVSWIWLLLLAAVILHVGTRYLFSQSYTQLEELQWHLYAIGFLLGLGGALVSNSHIRADIFYQRFSRRMRAWIEFYSLVLLFFPFVVFILVESVPFVQFAFVSGEVSLAPGGLPFRWLIKAMLPAGFLLLLIAGVARLLRVTRLLFFAE